ncbi:MAG: 4-(cytidine 5'-diphospho)-2-C-methyl-D-erythritol kinase [Deltaproteobacteria bacterium]|nr:4-(cytidine 5'-diphospho)-2-C-methyl-D-erythritol kinase [Deltaproteobacteria bacterium]
MPALTLLCPAKVNLRLEVLGRRDDGYHNIFSIMQRISLCDRLTLSARPGGIELTVTGVDLPADEGNIVYRAARLFLAEAGLTSGVSMSLVKRIPMAAGLGGGSSDAAATLVGLNHLFGAQVPTCRLMELARSLGADVPFFIFRGPAVAEGIGERLSEIKGLPRLSYVLVNIGRRISTAWAYEKLNLKLTKDQNDFIVDHIRDGSFNIFNMLKNDFEDVVFPEYPEVEAVKQRLLASGARGALMSGSGSTVFGLFLDRVKAERAFQSLTPEFGSGVWLARGV